MYILGVSAFFHDSAAALIKDGEIICAIEEEKFSRIKHDHSFPNKSIAFCLEFALIDFSKIQSIVFYDKPLLKFDRILETVIAFAPSGFKNYRKMIPEWISGKLILEKKILKEIETEFGLNFTGEIKFSEHHLSHAASAFLPSNFESSAILCIDGVGEWATVSAWTGQSNSIKPLWQINFPHSLGLLYSSFTQYLGFQVNEGEYKVMGLAPFGEPIFKDFIKDRLIDIQCDGTFMLNMNYFEFGKDLNMVAGRFEKLFGIPIRQKDEELTSFHKNIAASIQKITEEIVIKLAKKIQAETGAVNLCLAGGVALNCVANGKLESENIFEKIWVQPASSDSGGALGAALAYWYVGLKNSRSVTNGNYDMMKGSLLGPEYSNNQINAFLDQSSVVYDFYDKPNDMYKEISHDLINGCVVGWFQGRAEFGPRALGSRSIIADPRLQDMQHRINAKIKVRESFRPFAPVLIEEDIEKYFKRKSPSPYMLFTAQVRTKEGGRAIPAVVHVDGSSRIQTVNRDSTEKIRGLLDSFKTITQESILVNTSFNGSHEPIVLTPQDAFTTFLHTGLDVLVLEDFVIKKEKLINLDELKKKHKYLSQMPKVVNANFFNSDINDSKKTARKISMIIAFVFGIVLPLIKKNQVSTLALSASLLIMFLSYNEKCAKYVCNIWNLIGVIGHRVKKEILILISFYLVFTPIALVFKLTKRDFLKLDFSKKKTTYQIISLEKEAKFNSF